MTLRSIEWLADQGCLRLLDQRQLPHRTAYLDLTTADEVAEAIADMTVRGAPAIGVAASFGMVLAAQSAASQGQGAVELARADRILRAARPTAVNLAWALDRMAGVWRQGPTGTLTERVTAEALAIEAEDIAVNRAISAHAMSILPKDEVVFFHHCNTGALATVDLGTALGIIRTAHESGRKVMAYLDETRPRLQGAKLSSYELLAAGVPHAIVVDGAAAHLMRTRHVDLCVVGCDRVAANGDTANKIGTYGLALAAKDNNVPFYVAAPTSTIDLATPHGDGIEIELRDPAEILSVDGTAIAPQGAQALNPAFDITPARLITGFITERGIVRPPFTEGLAALMRR